jgi:hypothetical protein
MLSTSTLGIFHLLEGLWYQRMHMEPSSNCQNALDKIWEFHHQYPSKPGMIDQ